MHMPKKPMKLYMANNNVHHFEAYSVNCMIPSCIQPNGKRASVFLRITPRIIVLPLPRAPGWPGARERNRGPRSGAGRD